MEDGRPLIPPTTSLLWAVGAGVVHFIATKFIVPRIRVFKGCSAVSLGFEAQSFISCYYLGTVGLYLYLFDPNHPIPDRVLGYYGPGKHLAEVMMGYQMYQTIMCLAVKELRIPAMILHHIFSTLLAHQSMVPYLHGYQVFFFGLVEVSNWPLFFMDIIKRTPALRAAHPKAYQASRIAFAVFFVAIRIVWWTLVSITFWQDTIETLRTGRQPSTFAAYIFMIGNVVMTGLQYWWGRLIIRGIYYLVFPAAKAKAAKRQGEVSPRVDKCQ